jgi:hypothetical protein
MARDCAISRGEQSAEARREIVDQITDMNDRAHDDGCTVIERSSSSFFLNLLTGMSHGGVNDPLQRSRLKI